MIKTPKKVHVRMLHPGKNYHCWLEFVKSKLAWTSYMTKASLRCKQDVIELLDSPGFELIEVNSADKSDEGTQTDDGVNAQEIYEKFGRIV